MPLTRLTIKNFKSIKECDITFSGLNVLIGENGTGKTNILDAVNYFYRNLTDSNISTDIFDENNHYSNEVRISLTYDLSEFVKISKSNADTVPDFEKEEAKEKGRYSGYYKTIISMASKASNGKLRVELSQIKGCLVRWNYTYEERLIFKSLFPIFYIDTRNLDVTQWGYIWDILGELAKVSNSERKNITTNIQEALLDPAHETAQKLKVITDIFEAANVSVKPGMAKEFATNLTKVFFGGDSIRQRGRHLDYYSTGTNSVKYIELLLKSIDALSRVKMKEPIVLFDEPEISLHTNYLDELAEAITDVNARLSILISTHSSRLTKNLIIECDTILLYNVKLVNRYSLVYRMKRFPQYSPTSKYRVADDHINAYFSRVNLFVEGETELELFSNPYLRILFPKLKKIDVFKAVSEKPVLNIMNPQLSNSQIPYLCLIDIDKAISFDKTRKRFVLKPEYLPEDDKERFRYRNKHESSQYLYSQRKRVEAMQRKLHVHYYLPYLSCDDTNYYAFVSALQQYLLSYNVFCLSTTIEGALVNYRTLAFAFDFLKRNTKARDFEKFNVYWESLHKTDKLNLLRMLFNGKSDLLRSRKEAFKLVDSGIRDTLDTVTIGGKTSGWVSKYLDVFFKETADEIKDTFTEKKFRKYLESEDKRKHVLRLFEDNFFELYSLIERLCGMINE